MFIPSYVYRGNKIWNKIGPYIQLILANIGFLVVPILVILYFVVMLFLDDLRHSIIFPWILAYAVMQLWTVSYTYLVIVRESITVVKEMVKKESHWER